VVNRLRAAEAGAELADGAVAERVTPAGRDLDERAQHEFSLGQGRVGHHDRLGGMDPSGPQQDVEIEHAGSPAPAGAAAEAGLHVLEQDKQFAGGQRRVQNDGGVREAASCASECRRGQDRRSRGHRKTGFAQRTNRGGDDSCGCAVAAVPPIGPKRDGVACPVHPAAPTTAPMLPASPDHRLPPSPVATLEPPRDCPLCPRLVAFRQACRAEHPGWWNSPVPVFGDSNAWLGIAGLAPGKHGANRTGRAFTGDHAGVLLFETLAKFGLAEGTYRAEPDDGFRLSGAAIINSVRCLPPQNKPNPDEIAMCRQFYTAALDALPKVRVLVALGQIAHGSAVRTAGGRQAAYKFGHLTEHALPDGRILIDSYHCSRYNQNTGRLTREMFEAVFAKAVALGSSRKSRSS